MLNYNDIIEQVQGVLELMTEFNEASEDERYDLEEELEQEQYDFVENCNVFYDAEPSEDEEENQVCDVVDEFYNNTNVDEDGLSEEQIIELATYVAEIRPA